VDGVDMLLRGAFDQGPQTPNAHSVDAVDAYDRYLKFFGVVYEVSRQGAWNSQSSARDWSRIVA
jgi:hypothetical protein